MLAENMQRSDLTYMEQAHGFQMMMDLGETVETISQKTGFSKATVKHRLAINELDPEALKEAKRFFQPTISDFIALEKVKDLDKRNEILQDSMNSKDIQDGVDDYLEDVMVSEYFNYYKKFFEEAGWINEEKDAWFFYHAGYKEVEGALCCIDLLNGHTLIKEESLKNLISQIKGEVHFALCNSRIRVATYKKPKGKDDEDAREKQRKATEALKRKNKAALREIRAEICDAYMDFILNSKVEFKTAQQELSFFYCFLDLCRENSPAVTFYNLDEEKIKYQFNNQLSRKGYNKWETHHLKDFTNWTPLFQLLANIWWSLASSYNYFEDYDCRPNMDRLKVHQTFCDLLRDLDGFHIKEEWKPVLDGTSDLYIKEGK